MSDTPEQPKKHNIRGASDKGHRCYTTEETLRFAEVYVVNYNATEAALAMRPAISHAAAKVVGYRMVKRERTKEAIRIKAVETSRKTGLSAEWLERRLIIEASTAPTASARISALNTLAKRVPGFFEPEQIDVTMMTPEEREQKKREIIAKALAKASEGVGP